MKKVDANEQALQDFLLDIDCLDKLLPWIGGFNVFDVLKISRTEIRHSNVLAWLLSANETHGMGDSFIKGLVQRFVENNTDKDYDVFKLLLLDFYSFTVYREWKSIDLLLVSEKEKTLLAIENKVDSHEHSDQLNRYRQLLKKEYQGFQQIYIYLTPDGEEPSDTENWGILTYADITDVLEEILKRKELAPDAKLLVQNYKDVIRRDIVEDQELIELCNKIYTKHKKALDLIYEYSSNDRDQLLSVMNSTLQELENEGKIIYEESSRNTSSSFRTKEMDKLLPLLDTPIGAWGSENIYSFWFGLDSSGFNAYFELGGRNVPKAQQKIMNRIIDVAKPNDKRREEFKYKKLYSRRYNIKESDDMSETIRQQVVSAVEDMLRWEADILEKL